MAAKHFILKYNGIAKTLADWGIEDCQFESNDFAADTVTFMLAGRELDAAELFPYSSTVEIFFPDGVTRWFYGRVEPWKRDGSGQDVRHFGRLVGPWFYIEQIYKARITTATLPQGATDPVYITRSTPRVILNVGQAPNAGEWVTWTTGQQIADVINYFSDIGFPLQLGRVAPWSTPFSSPQQGITGAEVIRMMFQREPDFTCVWDYTTTPPTIHFLKSSTANLDPSLSPQAMAALVLPSQTIDLQNLTEDQISIIDRPDLQRSFVHIYYEANDSFGSQQYLRVDEDVYPDPPPQDTESIVRGIEMIVKLDGAAGSSQTQSGQFASAPFDPTDINQWIAWKQSLASEDVVGAVVLTAANTDDPASHPAPSIISRDGDLYNAANKFEILEGSWAPWMTFNNDLVDVPVTAQKIRVKAWIRVIKKRGVDGKQHTDYIPVHADFVACSLNTGGKMTDFTVTTQNVTALGETKPMGLAKSMYLAWQSLTVEGSLTRVEDVVTAGISRSFSLNFLSPNKPEWANALAAVRHVSGSLDRGTTKIEFGARLRVFGLQILDVLRATKFRTTVISLQYYFGGPMGGSSGGNILHPRKHHPRSVEHGSTHHQVHVVSDKANPTAGVNPVIQSDGVNGVTTWAPGSGDPANPSGGRVIIDAKKAMGSDKKWHTIALQEQKVCVKNADGSLSQRTVIVLCSDAFQAPDDPA